MCHNEEMINNAMNLPKDLILHSIQNALDDVRKLRLEGSKEKIDEAEFHLVYTNMLWSIRIVHNGKTADEVININNKNSKAIKFFRPSEG